MKHKPLTIAGAVFTVAILSSVNTSAETLTWAPGGDINEAGPAAWLGADNWRNEDNDQVTWVDGSDAVFHRTVAGTATVSANAINFPRVVESLTFTLGPDAEAGTLLVTTILPNNFYFVNTTGNFHVGEGAQLIFQPSLQDSTNGLTLDGGGTLRLQPALSTFTGDITILAGTLMPDTNTSLGNLANSIIMGDNAILRPRGHFDSARNIQLTGAATYQLDSNPIDATLSGEISGSGQLTFAHGVIATSLVTLGGSNTYTGGTIIDLSGPGLVIADNNSAFGTGDVSLRGASTLRIEPGINGISNNITVESTNALLRVIFEDESYHVGTTGALASGFDGDTENVAARILAGTSGADATLEMRFSPTATADNDELRVSDVFTLNGISTEDALYVLQLSSAGVHTDSFIAWLDDDFWVNAVLGNTDNNAGGDQEGFLGSFDSFQDIYGFDLDEYIGAWGVDTTSGDVWAVLNHYNADFSILPVPEPSAARLLILAGLTLIVLRHKRQRTLSAGR